MDTLQHKLWIITLIQAWDITESTPAPQGSLQSTSKIFQYCYYSSPGHLLTVSFNDNADTTQLTTRGTTTTRRSTLQYIPTLLTSPPSTPAPALVLSAITTLSGSSLTDHLSPNIPRGRLTNIWAVWAVIKEISSNSLLMDHIGLFTQKQQIPTNFPARKTNTDSRMFWEKIARPSQNILVKITFTTTTSTIPAPSTVQSAIRTQSRQQNILMWRMHHLDGWIGLIITTGTTRSI